MCGRPSSIEWWIASEPRGPAFEGLLRYCREIGSHCSLVDLFPRSKNGRAARERFLSLAKPHLLAIDDVSSWPGGGVVKGTAPLWKFTLSEDLLGLLVTVAKGLYDLRSPNLPEDFAVYRADGSVLLGSVAHEHSGWMNLTADEQADRRLGLVELRRRGK